jgi:hypothetical protein
MITKLNEKWNNKFEYIFPHDYKNSRNRLLILCPFHGIFNKIAKDHLYGNQQCPNCTWEQTIYQPFVDKANKIHNFKYAYGNYHGLKIEILCPAHGIFHQRRDDHLRGKGCKQCVSTSFSKKAIVWLQYLEKHHNITIQKATDEIGEFQIPNTKLKVDGYHKETNTVYEFDGDAFHGNLDRYPPDSFCHPFSDKLTAQQLHDRTIKRREKIIKLGYNVVHIWESDWDKIYETIT